jgi:prolyl-tRNA editing enzyme YbaK/EbsC (Cys-tRNA(Pro) deacylase)
MSQTEHASVARVRASFARAGVDPEVRTLADTARSAAEAAAGLGVDVGQIASSIVFRVDLGDGDVPVLVVTSGRHRVDTGMVSEQAGLPKLGRADADFVREWSGFAIGGVSPTGWAHGGDSYTPLCFVDTALAEYDVVWAASGHTHVVYRTTFDELVAITGGRAMAVAEQ